MKLTLNELSVNIIVEYIIFLVINLKYCFSTFWLNSSDTKAHMFVLMKGQLLLNMRGTVDIQLPGDGRNY